MKKLTIITVIIASIIFVSCSENELDEQPICTGENYAIEINRFIKKLTTTQTGTLPSIRNYEYTYNTYNLLSKVDNYTFDTDAQLKYNYICNNSLNTIADMADVVRYEYSYDALNRISAYKTTDRYLHDYTLKYIDNKVIAEGTINVTSNIAISLETNSNGLVTKLSRFDGYTTFDYDANGNMIRVKDFKLDHQVLHDYEISYDANLNPFYGQLTASYLERFIHYFSDSAFLGIDVFFRNNQYNFPYLKNNPVVLEYKNCTSCYSEILKRTYEYDAQNYPIKMEESHYGAPVVMYEYQYN